MPKSTGSNGGRYYTVLRNLAKNRRPFGYLGTYGREVAGGGEFVLKGQIEDNPEFNDRNRAALARDKAEGRIVIELIPADFAEARIRKGFPKTCLGRSC